MSSNWSMIVVGNNRIDDNTTTIMVIVNYYWRRNIINYDNGFAVLLSFAALSCVVVDYRFDGAHLSWTHISQMMMMMMMMAYSHHLLLSPFGFRSYNNNIRNSIADEAIQSQSYNHRLLQSTITIICLIIINIIIIISSTTFISSFQYGVIVYIIASIHLALLS